MSKYKLLLSTSLRRIKNRIIITLIENTYNILILLMFLILVAASYLYLTNIYIGLIYQNEFAHRLYYCYIFMSQIPFVVLKLCEKESKDINYFYIQILGQKSKFVNVLKSRLFAEVISFLIVIFFVTRFKNIYHVWGSINCFATVLVIQILSISVIYIIKKTVNNLVPVAQWLYQLLYIVCISFFSLLLSNIASYLFVSEYIVPHILFVIGIIILQFIYMKIILKDLQMKIVTKSDRKKSRIAINESSPYLCRAMIGSGKYILYCFGCYIFIFLFSRIFNLSQIMNYLLSFLICLGVIIFESDRINENSLNVILNLNASIKKYIYMIEHYYYIISLIAIILFVFINSIVSESSFFQELVNLCIPEIVFLIYVSIIEVNCLRIILGNRIKGILNYILIMLTAFITFLLFPYFIATFGIVQSIVIGIIVLQGIQYGEIRYYDKFKMH